MNVRSGVDTTAVAERVLQLLDDTAATATYKYAVLLAILELCVEKAHERGGEPDSLTTRDLAQKVIELYWPHTGDWSAHAATDAQATASRLLRQNASKGREIVTMIAEFRAQHAATTGGSAPCLLARRCDPEGWRALVDEVEWKLIEMPLGKLQRIGGEDVRWLYDIRWLDKDAAERRGLPAVREGEVRRYQLGQVSPFDNLIRLLPGVAEALVRLHLLLRPFIEQQWARKVAAINKLPEARLTQFLFGMERQDLTPVRSGLVELQQGQCFYCDGRVSAANAQVDHFLPWSRYANNSLANLVAADARCNRDKSDFLAAERHVRRWRERLDGQAEELGQLADLTSWQVEGDRVLGAARSLYRGLPDDARLWNAAGELRPAGSAVFQAWL